MSKRFISLFLLIVFALSLTACDQFILQGPMSSNQIRGSGHVVSETRNVTGFDRVVFTGSGDATITLGDTENVVVEAEDNILPLIETTVLNGQLSIGLKPNTSISSQRGIHYTINAKSLAAVETLGSSNITVTNLVKADAFSATTSGSGNIQLAGLQAGKFDSRSSGSGNIQATGKVDSLSASTFGSGNLNFGELQSASASATTSGSGDINLWATDSLDARTSGSGNVRYYGEPSVNRSESGSGRVTGLGSK